MKLNIYSITCNPDYFYDSFVRDDFCSYDRTYGMGFDISFDESLWRGEIVYDKNVITDGEAKEMLAEDIEKRILETIKGFKKSLFKVDSLLTN